MGENCEFAAHVSGPPLEKSVPSSGPEKRSSKFGTCTSAHHFFGPKIGPVFKHIAIHDHIWRLKEVDGVDIHSNILC